MNLFYKKKMYNKGFAHVLAPLIIVLLFGVMGTLFLKNIFAAPTYSTIVNSNGKCLDNYANLTKEANKVILYDCNQTDAQKWVLKDGGTVVNANGYCMTASSGKSGAAVTLNKCTGASSQQWVHSSTNSTIKSKQSGLCLDNYANLNENMNRIQVYKCNATSAQKWTPKPIVVPAALPVIASFIASPNSITAGGTSKLSWSVTGSVSCSVTPGGPTDTTALTWTTPAQSTAGTKDFTLSCKNKDGVAVTKNTSLTVTAVVQPTAPALKGCYANGVTAPCIGGVATGASGWNSPVFSDEFNATNLDANKWVNCFFPASFGGSDTCGEMNDSVTLKSNVRMENGSVVLRQSTTVASSSKDAGSLINTDPKQVGSGKGFQMGAGHFAEARVFFPGNGTNCYNWPAWWINGGQSGFSDGEIDVAEIGGAGVMGSNYHFDRGNGREIFQNKIPGYWCGDYHTYGVDRQAGKNVIYFDGKQVASYATYDKGAPQYLIFNVGFKDGKTPATGAASDVKVDYVRVWKK